MSPIINVDYALAQVWKQRAEAAVKVQNLAALAVKAEIAAVRAKPAQSAILIDKARLAAEAAAKAAREAEQIWADTSVK